MIEAVVVCVNYGDFLSVTLPLNKNLFQNMVVVTTPDDEETKTVCEYNHVRCIETNAFGTERGEFNKGAAINEGLNSLGLTDWVVQLDADIVLPPLTSLMLSTIERDPTMLYGIDRHDILGRKAWDAHQSHPQLQHENSVYVHAPYSVATRFAPIGGGYVPIGFFQLWNPKASGVYRYPEQHTNAGRTDMQFANNWPRPKRALLPELIAYHLLSEVAPQGVNWDGRQTARFEHVSRCRHWWHKHKHHCRRHHPHHHHHPHPYCEQPDFDDQ